jgi:CBS domain-containing protein
VNANALRPVHQFPTVRQHMTASPHTISTRQSLSIARRTMLEHQIRHLPVLEGGRIVGLLSERDLLLVESLPGVNPTDVWVEEAMVQSVFTATPDEPRRRGRPDHAPAQARLGRSGRRRAGRRGVHHD